jgi:hypothetical protein
MLSVECLDARNVSFMYHQWARARTESERTLLIMELSVARCVRHLQHP